MKGPQKPDSQGPSLPPAPALPWDKRAALSVVLAGLALAVVMNCVAPKPAQADRDTANSTETSLNVQCGTSTVNAVQIVAATPNNGELFLFALSTAPLSNVANAIPDRALIKDASTGFSISVSSGSAWIPLNQWIYYGWYSGPLYCVTTSTNPVWINAVRTR